MPSSSSTNPETAKWHWTSSRSWHSTWTWNAVWTNSLSMFPKTCSTWSMLDRTGSSTSMSGWAVSARPSARKTTNKSGICIKSANKSRTKDATWGLNQIRSLEERGWAAMKENYSSKITLILTVAFITSIITLSVRLPFTLDNNHPQCHHHNNKHNVIIQMEMTMPCSYWLQETGIDWKINSTSA